MKAKLLLILFGLALLTSCTSTTAKEEGTHVEIMPKYVYIDIHNCVHMKPCSHIRLLSSESSSEPRYCVNFIKIEDLYKQNIKGYCAYCVSVEDYEWLQKEIDKHEIIEYNPNDDNTMPGVKTKEKFQPK